MSDPKNEEVDSRLEEWILWLLLNVSPQLYLRDYSSKTLENAQLYAYRRNYTRTVYLIGQERIRREELLLKKEQDERKKRYIKKYEPCSFSPMEMRMLEAYL